MKAMSSAMGGVSLGVGTTRRKVLVVDPDRVVLAFVAEALHSFRPGFDVATAVDLEQASAWLDTFTPDLRELLIATEFFCGFMISFSHLSRLPDWFLLETQREGVIGLGHYALAEPSE